MIRKLAQRVDSTLCRVVDQHSVSAFLLVPALTTCLMIYGAHEYDRKVLHPRFYEQYSWLLQEPREVQEAYARKINKVGEFNWGIQEYVKEYGARLFLEELEECEREGEVQQ
jgi:hypothetical protein